MPEETPINVRESTNETPVRANRIPVERLARAIRRVQENLHNKENMYPTEHTTRDTRGRIRRVRELRRLHRRSPLPPNYPRIPLQDITAIVNALSRSRSRVRRGRFLPRISPRRPRAQRIPLQEILDQEVQAEGPGTGADVTGDTISITQDGTPSEEHRQSQAEEQTTKASGADPISVRNQQNQSISVSANTKIPQSRRRRTIKNASKTLMSMR